VQMAVRVKAVAKIAVRERHKRVRLNEQAYLAASKGAVVRCFARTKRTDLEGFLFPATYDFLRGTTSKQLVAAQLTAFRRAWKGVDLRYARSKHLTPFDVLIIASMVEKEAVAPDERPKIAAVIYNRLAKHMTLGIDATLQYVDPNPSEGLTESDLKIDSPYNTRLSKGLPPTPIASPGLPSLRAALEPAQTKDLYYVLCGTDGHHVFATTYAQFLQLKSQCLG